MKQLILSLAIFAATAVVYDLPDPGGTSCVMAEHARDRAVPDLLLELSCNDMSETAGFQLDMARRNGR